MIVGLLAALLSTAGATNAGATTSTTLPGPAPNQSQINATKSQVGQVESTLAQEEQQTSILDEKYDTAQQNVQDAQAALQTIATSLVQERSAVKADKRLVATDAVAAYVYGTPETGFASYFSQSATQNQERNQYTNQIVGNLSRDETSLLQSESRLQSQEVAQQAEEAQAQSEAAQAKALAQSNEQEAAATKATLNQVQGQLAQEVAAAAIQEAQQEAAAAAAGRGTRRRSNRQRLRPRRRQPSQAQSRRFQCCRGDDGGRPSCWHDRPGRRIRIGWQCRDGGGAGGGSHLGVPYVFGGEQAGVGFDCSGLVQWAWAQAGTTIPRTTEIQWPSLPHVSLDRSNPVTCSSITTSMATPRSTTWSCMPVRVLMGLTR